MPRMRHSSASSSLDAYYFDRAITTRNLRICGLVLSWILGIFSVSYGFIVYKVEHVRDLPFTSTWREAIYLAVNALITICNEMLGYIHTVSLRWALSREQRLTFNSNLRLIASSKSSRPNSWYFNLLTLSGMVATYSSSSFIMVTYTQFDRDLEYTEAGGIYAILCPAALVALGCGVLVQAMVASWSLIEALHAPTLSTNPLDTAAASLSAQNLAHREDRCMMGVEKANWPSQACLPKAKQTSAYRCHGEVRRVVWLAWVTVGLGLLWGVTINGVVFGSHSEVKVTRGPSSDFGEPSISWSPLPSDGTPYTNMGGEDLWVYDTGTIILPAIICFWPFAFIAGLQAVLTLCLHCAELQVNCVRDETMWHRASSSAGLPRQTPNSLTSFVKSWHAMTLFTFKTLIHWLFGLAMTVNLTDGVVMRPIQIMYLCVGIVALAVFTTAMSLWRPRGPQPATFGHLQTLVDLKDHWPAADERLYWGDKNDKGLWVEVRHAGISTDPLQWFRRLSCTCEKLARLKRKKKGKKKKRFTVRS